MNRIYLYTVQHTGTWFLVKALLEHPEVKGFHTMEGLNSPKGHGKKHQVTDFGTITEGLSDGWNVIHVHAEFMKDQRDNFKKGAMLHALFQTGPTVIPLRDPLLSVISRHRRHAALHPHFDLIYSWADFLGFVNSRFGVDFIPIPVGLDTTLDHVNHMYDRIGLSPHKLKSTTPANSVNKPSSLLDAYNNKDMRWINANFSIPIQELRHHIGAYKPYFSQHGIDLWWV